MSFTFEQEQYMLRDLLTSAESDSETDNSEGSKNDHILGSEHDSNSEQEDDSEITEEEIDTNSEFYYEKDGTKSKKNPRA